MDEKNGKNPLLALTVATVLFAALGVIVFTQAPFKGVRPSVPEIKEPSEKIRARLWQDPFQAVLDHVKAIKAKGKQEKVKEETKRKLDSIVAGQINLIKCQKENFTNKDFLKRLENNEVTVLGAMVFGGPYAELVESRIRQRYAVLSALNRLQFYPENSEHIGCFIILNTKDGQTTLSQWDQEFTLSNIV